MSDDLKNIVEAVLLASDGPVTVARIQGLFEEEARPEATRIHEAIGSLQAECEERGVELRKIGSGYRYQTHDKYAQYLRKLHAVKPPRMSRALLETLAIIAYRQPVSRGDIEEVRGVAVSAEMMQRLLERDWVKQVGVRDVPGRPALFGTTAEFLSYFNLSSLKDLPDLMEQRELGEIAGEMETPLPPEILAALELDEGQKLNDESVEQAEEAGGEEGVEAETEAEADVEVAAEAEAEAEAEATSETADLQSRTAEHQDGGLVSDIQKTEESGEERAELNGGFPARPVNAG